MARPRSRSRVTDVPYRRDGTVRPVGAHHHHTHGTLGSALALLTSGGSGLARSRLPPRMARRAAVRLGEFTHRHERGHVPRDLDKAGMPHTCRLVTPTTITLAAKALPVTLMVRATPWPQDRDPDDLRLRFLWSTYVMAAPVRRCGDARHCCVAYRPGDGEAGSINGVYSFTIRLANGKSTK